ALKVIETLVSIVREEGEATKHCSGIGNRRSQQQPAAESTVSPSQPTTASTVSARNNNAAACCPCLLLASRRFKNQTRLSGRTANRKQLRFGLAHETRNQGTAEESENRPGTGQLYRTGIRPVFWSKAKRHRFGLSGEKEKTK
ncbi:hypothetical protein PIB30_059171, partial [Stylosanthes scabra]|nr:hypothetical protein [Stylosanthes scabra]